jgi:predicted AlkP superfamily phosphohydrolase/phosphomutase
MTRVLVVGLDGLDWELASRWMAELPTLAALAARGAHGPLESIVQPVTPPAWTSMVSGHNPGHFGFTDFTARQPGTYARQRLVHSGMVRADTIFELADRAGLRTIALSVPVSYPPRPRRRGVVLSCIMAPGPDKLVTQPAALRERLLELTSGPLLFDAASTDHDVAGDRDALIAKITRLDDQRFEIATALAGEGGWDLLFMVCPGTDRVAHYFLHHGDQRHVAHQADGRYGDAVLDHYRHCDQRLGELLDAAGPDTVVLVASDHGVQRLDGKLNLNDWLVRMGYLKLDSELAGPRRLDQAPVDWAATQAWAHGFGGQIFLNRRGLYPAGWLDEQAAEATVDKLTGDLAGLARDGGEPIEVQVLHGDDLYDGPFRRLCPDLCLQLDGLRLLTRNSVGNQRLVTAPDVAGDGDVASHTLGGFLSLSGPGVPDAGRCDGLSIYDVAPTILELLGVGGDQMEGVSLVSELAEAYSGDDQAVLSSRLQALYLD